MSNACAQFVPYWSTPQYKYDVSEEDMLSHDI